MSQLYRYFSGTEARFGILTNGIIAGSSPTLSSQTRLTPPSDEVMRLLIGRVYDGKLAANVLVKFGPLVQGDEGHCAGGGEPATV